MADDPKPDETPDERRTRRIEEARARMAEKRAKPAEPTIGDSEAPKAAPAANGANPAPPPTTKRRGGPLELDDIASDPLVVALVECFGDAVVSAKAMLGQRIVTVGKPAILDVMHFLKADSWTRFDFLVDLTAVHRPAEDPPFEVVYQLCSTATRERVRVKVGLGDGEPVPSVVGVWSTADWLEREAFDMFGIRFDGHPNLRRILLPEGWEGHPLRKEYPVEFRENAWVRENLNIVELPSDADFTGKFEV